MPKKRPAETRSDCHTEVTASGSGNPELNPSPQHSDSGDSLFITQKPVPQAVRSAGRRPSSSHRSALSSPLRSLADSDDDVLHFDCPTHHQSGKRRKKLYNQSDLPKYSFSFSKGRKHKPSSTKLPLLHNTRLHYAAMGGFFDCVRKIQASRCSKADQQLSTPTVDDIIPISEKEEGNMKEEDFKVVGKKQFVVLSKTKRPQPWYIEKKTGSEEDQQRRGASNPEQETTQRGRRLEASQKTPSAARSGTETSGDGGSACRVSGQRKTKGGHEASDGSLLGQSETPNAEISVKNVMEEDDLPVKKHKKKMKKKLLGADVGQEVDGPLDCSVMEEDTEPVKSDAAADPLNDNDTETARKRGLTVSSDFSQIAAEQSEEPGDGLEITIAPQEMPKKKRKKHRKKDQSCDANDDAAVGEDDLNNDLSIGVLSSAESTSLPVKKKKDLSVLEDVFNAPENDEREYKTQTTEGVEKLDAEVAAKKEKKKKKREKSQPPAPSTDLWHKATVCLPSAGEKTRTTSFLTADTAEKRCPSQSGDSAEFTGSLEASGDGVRKKKKKRRKMSLTEQSGETDLNAAQPMALSDAAVDRTKKT
ncbi:uncharacterized protein KZ484_017203 [Pholidichthys leucotaenia]